ncbi:MAG: FliM/FliN family flagellar motor switch protein [Bryobacterales bacterium]|jgi:flagellar motor switch/type III secretory pathway protein FliN|nr:FliM/FliN family flagellar motor switch protein [Bryobacterales bacterium]
MLANDTRATFGDLPRYSSAELQLVNWGQRFVRPASDWESHLRGALGDLLETPDQKEWVVHVKHWMDRSRPAAQVPFDRDTITIGREEGGGIVLPESSVNREHARLLQRGEGFYLEDLGSRLGTFIGDLKLLPHTPTHLAPGCTFTIFPYSLEVTSRYRWKREERFRVHTSQTRACSWRDALVLQSADAITVSLSFPPASGFGSFSITGRLLDELIQGMLGKDHLSAAGLLGTDAGCVDYVFASLSERLRAELAWPFVAELGSWLAPVRIAPDTRGLFVSAQIGIRNCTGVVRLFLPFSLLDSMRALASSPVAVETWKELDWSCIVDLATVPLAACDVRNLAPGDTVMLQPRPRLLLPGDRAAWSCQALDSNFRRLRLHNSLERIPRLETHSDPPTAQSTLERELQELPVLLQVLLGEKRFTLAELQALTAGVLIDLERTEAEPVSIAVNGKVLGSGELVRIEEHLGVRVLGWNQ